MVACCFSNQKKKQKIPQNCVYAVKKKKRRMSKAMIMKFFKTVLNV